MRRDRSQLKFTAAGPGDASMKPRREMATPWFGSRSLAVHLLRGLIGVGSFVAGLLLAIAGHVLAALLSLLLMLAVLRGCPTCWLLGLLQTLSAGRARRRCAGDRCTLTTATERASSPSIGTDPKQLDHHTSP
jgi:hypothetical protein